ncbi:MAG TPA: putative Ig domain-containing protein [Verrucomicrobiae bacterium]
MQLNARQAMFLISCLMLLLAGALYATAACPDLAGPWTVTENSTTVTTINGSAQPPSTQTGTGQIVLTQTGCTATYCQDVYNPNTGATEHVCRVGTISGNTVTFTGIAMLPVPGLTFSRNSMVAVGTISPDNRRIDATSTVDVAFSGLGITGTVNGGGTEVFISNTPQAAPTITTSSPLPAGTVGTPYTEALSATGGATPYTWSIASGNLPSGLGLSNDGVISGTPGAATIATFTIQVTGNNGMSSTKPFSLTINCCDNQDVSVMTIAEEIHLSQGAVKVEKDITAISGEHLILWSVNDHFELRYYLPGSSTGVIDGYVIGLCHWHCGRNLIAWTAKDVGGVPKCFRSVRMVNQDYGVNDCGDDIFRQYTFVFTPCDMKLSVSLDRFTYAASPPTSCVDDARLAGTLLSTRIWCDGVTPQSQFPQCLVTALAHDCDPNSAAKDLEPDMFTVPFAVGDVNFDGVHDAKDFAMAINSEGSCKGDSRYNLFMDIDGNGCITVSDLKLLFPSDSDGDGLADWQEYIAGTDPFDAGSAFRITRVERSSNGAVTLYWPSVINRLYTVMGSGQVNFSSPVVLSNAIVATPPTNSFTDVAATNLASIYYRLGVTR